MCENPATKARPNCRAVAIALKGDSGCTPILLQLQIACTLRATQPHRVVPGHREKRPRWPAGGPRSQSATWHHTTAQTDPNLKPAQYPSLTGLVPPVPLVLVVPLLVFRVPEGEGSVLSAAQIKFVTLVVRRAQRAPLGPDLMT